MASTGYVNVAAVTSVNDESGDVDLDAADVAALPAAGGTVTGDLAVGAEGTETARQLRLVSSFEGGENDTDSTSRIILESHQRAQRLASDGVTLAHFGEVQRIRLYRENAKAMLAWQDAFTDPDNPYSVVWIGAHHEANDGLSYHSHWSIEVPDAALQLQTRLEITFGDRAGGIGVDKAVIKTSDADFIVGASNGRLIVAGANGVAKNLDFSTDSYGAVAGRRWQLQTDTTTESGSNAGSDLRINRLNDAGTFVDSPITIRRSTGVVGVGISAPTSITARLDVSESGSRHTVLATQTTTGTVTFATYGAVLGAVANRYFDGRVSGDSSGRVAIFGDGKLEWGDGGAGGRDTVLYRDSANLLRTDDSLRVDLRIGVGQAPDATAKVATTSTANGISFHATNTNGSGNTGGAHFHGESATATSLLLAGRVTGESVNRLAARVDGQITWGDGTATRDTNLYRSAADVLKTDDSFHVGADLQVRTTSLGGGVGVIGLANASTAPTSNPTSAVAIYAESGLLKWRGTTGAHSLAGNAWGAITPGTGVQQFAAANAQARTTNGGTTVELSGRLELTGTVNSGSTWGTLPAGHLPHAELKLSGRSAGTGATGNTITIGTDGAISFGATLNSGAILPLDGITFRAA